MVVKEKVLNGGFASLQWALPESLEIPPDELKARLDFYGNSIMLYWMGKGIISSKLVSANEITLALLSTVSLKSGILPEGTLWWGQGKEGVEVALWRPPRLWQAALKLKVDELPRRFKLPMPGLIFVCSPNRPPKVYAAKRRPRGPGEAIYHAPLFNVYTDGRTCPGTHKYPANIAEIPESFFLSFFTMEARYGNRSKSHPDSLLKLWEEIDGKKKYPTKDLVPIGKLDDIMK